MKKIYYTIATLLILSTGFSLRAQESIYDFELNNPYRLPPMEVLIDMDEIAASYQTQSHLYMTEITGVGDDKVTQSSSAFVSDARVVDAIRLLERYAGDCLIDPSGRPEGSAELSVIYFNQHQRANLGSIIGVLTFGFGTLLGIPYATVIVDIEVQSEFYDAGDILQAGYRGTGQAKKLESLFNNSSTRLTHQRAMKRAIVDMNGQIMADRQRWQD